MFSIIEMTVVLVAAAMLTVVSIKDDVAKRRTEVLTAEGQNEGVLYQALVQWVTDNYTSLVSQLVAPGPTSVTPPTLGQLQSAGYLKTTYASGPYWGGTYNVAMSVGPAGCASAPGGCHVSFTFYPSKPVTRNGQPDPVGASIVAQAAATGFGFSKAQNSATVYGLNGSWTAANPVPGTPPGVVLAVNGPSTDGNSVYIRRDGSLTWTGDQNANGVSINNLKNVTATGNISAATANLQAGNALNIGGGAIYYGDSTNAAIRTGTLYVQNQGGSAPAPIVTGDSTTNGNSIVTGNSTVQNNLYVWQTITPGRAAWPRGWCPTNGAAAQNADGRGQWLSCQDNVWLPIGGTALRYNYYVVQNGWSVPTPPCMMGGTPQIVATPQNIYVDPTATLNVTTSGSGPWTVWITDGNGNGMGGNVVVETYCAY
ncbi:hypothetical protein ACV229_16530 [Burkholderia sp. MR1-5-21]